MTRLHRLLVALATTLLALAMTLTLAPSAQATDDETTAPAASGGVTLDTDATVALPTGGTVTPITSPPARAELPGTELDWSETRKWYGKQYRFTERETRNIAAGGSICSSFIKKIPGLGVACAAASGSANLALANGKCLAYNVYYGGGSNPWYWNC